MWSLSVPHCSRRRKSGPGASPGVVEDAVWVSDNIARSRGHLRRRRAFRGACSSHPSSCSCRHRRHVPAHRIAGRTRAPARSQTRQCDADLPQYDTWRRLGREHLHGRAPPGCAFELRIDNVMIEIDGPERRSWTARRSISSGRSIWSASPSRPGCAAISRSSNRSAWIRTAASPSSSRPKADSVLMSRSTSNRRRSGASGGVRS